MKFQTLEQVLNSGAKKCGNSERRTGSNTQVDAGSDANGAPFLEKMHLQTIEQPNSQIALACYFLLKL